MKEVKVCKVLNTSQIQVLAEKLSSHTYKANETIISEGDPVDTIFIVANGEVSLHRNDVDEATILEKKNTFGEESLYQDSNAYASRTV